MYCTHDRMRVLILAAAAIGFAVLLSVIIGESLSSHKDNIDIMILAIPTFVLFFVIVAMLCELRRNEVHEYRPPDFYEGDRL